MIHVLRHPVDMIHSWVVRGWGSRFLNDPRSFTLTIENSGINLPWYCFGMEEKWLALNPMERCVETVLGLIEKSIAQYKKAKYPNKIHNVIFEEFVQNTNLEMEKICDFVGTAKTFATTNALMNAKCPRILNISDRNRKIEEFRIGIANDLFEELINFSRMYEQDFYGFAS